ncbi:MAG: peptidase M28, partial [Gemmobacter sp.]
IAAYQQAAGDRFDLGPSRAAAEALLAALEAFHAGVAAGKIAQGSANAVIQGLARILVPINFTRVPRFRHDPALTIPPLPSIHAATELDRHTDTLGFAQNHLMRGQNQLVAALRQAVRMVQAA